MPPRGASAARPSPRPSGGAEWGTAWPRGTWASRDCRRRAFVFLSLLCRHFQPLLTVGCADLDEARVPAGMGSQGSQTRRLFGSPLRGRGTAALWPDILKRVLNFPGEMPALTLSAPASKGARLLFRRAARNLHPASSEGVVSCSGRRPGPVWTEQDKAAASGEGRGWPEEPAAC